MTWIARVMAVFSGGSMMWLYMVAALALFAAGWTVKGWRMDLEIAELVAVYDKAKDEAVQVALARRDQQASAYSKIDKLQYGKLTDAKKKTDDLRAAIANGSRRLLVNAKCSTSPPVSAAADGSSVGDGPSPELDRVSESAYFAHRDGIEQVMSQLRACQALLRVQGGAHE